MGRLLLLVVMLTACGPIAPPHAAVVTRSPIVLSPRPSPSPARSDYLAVVGGPKDGSVSLVASDGTVVATARVDLPSVWMHTQMSWTSASRSRLYYLDGSEVRFLTPDGTAGLATKIALGAGEQAGFAVSPDDASIAVAVFSYTPLPVGSYRGMLLYVEDLSGGGHHVDIFTSTTVAEFPVGWTGGRLILAVSEPRCCRKQTVNPYDATSYHVVDPATGSSLASVCENSAGPEGPIEPIGAICYHPGAAPSFERWDGSPFDFPGAVPNPTEYLSAISPDGTRVAVGQSQIWIYGPGGRAEPLHQSGHVFGWLDESHIVIQPGDVPSLSVIEVDGFTFRATADISPWGVYLGTLPAAVT